MINTRVGWRGCYASCDEGSRMRPFQKASYLRQRAAPAPEIQAWRAHCAAGNDSARRVHTKRNTLGMRKTMGIGACVVEDVSGIGMRREKTCLGRRGIMGSIREEAAGCGHRKNQGYVSSRRGACMGRTIERRMVEQRADSAGRCRRP
jgi:hypothetical protein